ncbi:MAG: response regulator [Vicinamibacterales bacterium]
MAVVDDDPTVTMMLSRILSRSGYDVQVFTSGEAILAASPGQVHVICLNLSLPGIDGFETLARLKQAGSTTPVILFSASASGIAERAKTAGAFACVSKTGAWEELKRTIAAAMDATRGTAPDFGL